MGPWKQSQHKKYKETIAARKKNGVKRSAIKHRAQKLGQLVIHLSFRRA